MSIQKLYSKSLAFSNASFLFVIFSILIILVATLFPFNFSLPKSSFTGVFSSFIHPSHLTDRIKNMLLFLPLGFSLMYWLQKSRLNTTVKIIIVLLSSASLSLLVETLQYFLPSRKPTPADILNNTFSGFLGLLCYVWISRIHFYILKLVAKNKSRLSIQQLVVIFVGYLILPLIVSFPLQSLVNLSTWNLNFPLLLGNELTGNRPWRGYISEVYIADRTISKKEISKLFDKDSFASISDSPLAYYQLNNQDRYFDQTKRQSDLIWRGQPIKVQQEQPGVFLSSRHWLETATPVTFLNQRIRETAQFTIGATFATAAILQTGPARIISISSNASERNLTLGQAGRDLIFRIRTPLSGDNADYIYQVVPNVFTDNKAHRVVATYANSALHVYVDRLENLHSFYFLEMLPKADKLLYYGLIFIPLGYLLGIIVTAVQRRTILYIFLYGGMLIPALTLEVTLAMSSGRSIQASNLLLSVLITAFTLLIFKSHLLAWQKPGVGSHHEE